MEVLLVLLVLAFPVVAIVGLVIAVGTRTELRTLQAQFEAFRKDRPQAPAAAAAASRRPAPEPLQAPPSLAPPPSHVDEPPRAAPPTLPPPQQVSAPARPTEPPPAAIPADPVVAPRPAASVPPVAPPPPPPPEPPKPAEPQISFEERLGTQWTVWVGGVALALGGFFLVRYSIEQGWFGPGMRIFLGAVMALVLIAAGEWARRKENSNDIGSVPSAHIPSILTAAGTAVAYADVWAAYALYEFIGAGAAFVLLGVVALGTLAAALVHGPALAGLGLVGAYVTPLIVSTGKPNFWALYIYLAVVTAAAFMLARARMWRWLAFTAVAFSVFWTLPGPRLAASHRRRGALLPRGRGLCAGRCIHRVRAAVRTGRRGRQVRPGVDAFAGGLSVRRAADRADEPARHAGADGVRCAHRGDGGDRLADRGGGRRIATGGRDGRAGVPALLRRTSISKPCSARAGRPRSAARDLHPASRARRGLRRAVRRRRVPGARTFQEARRYRCCGRPARCSCRSRSWLRCISASTSSSSRSRSPPSPCCSPHCLRSPPRC